MGTRLRTAASVGALVVALAGLATACGGGGRLSAHAYVREASRICRQASHRAHHADRVGGWAAIQTRAADGLAGLRPPASLARFDTVWVALVRQSAAELGGLVVSTRARETDVAAQRRDAVFALTARAAQLARAQGITACPVYFTPVESSA